MSKIANIKAVAIRTAGRSGLVLKKYSPEILMVTGIVGIVGSTVMACRATLKAEYVLDTAKDKFDMIHEAHESSDPKEYSEQDFKKDMTIAYVQTGVDFVKLYGPSVTLGVASIACILGAHNIMRKRNLALVAAYKAVEGAFADYRRRVVAELGEDKDRQFRYNLERIEHTTVGVDPITGKKIKNKEVIEAIDPNEYSQYARFFDDGNKNWDKNAEYNLLFLKCQQNYANDLLHSRGHIFLNEVYDMIGTPRSQEGSVVGWTMSKDGDNFVDFGIWDLVNSKSRDFVNGYERAILLDFNVDGVIYNMI